MERGTNENTNRLIRRYLPKGIPITDHQPYLDAIADDLGRLPEGLPRLPNPTRSLRRTTRCFHDLTPPNRRDELRH